MKTSAENDVLLLLANLVSWSPPVVLFTKLRATNCPDNLRLPLTSHLVQLTGRDEGGVGWNCLYFALNQKVTTIIHQPKRYEVLTLV